MVLDTRPLSEITREAIDVLLREIGAINTVRFLNQFTGGFGNYTEERRVLFDHLTIDDIVAGIEQDRLDTQASKS